MKCPCILATNKNKNYHVSMTSIKAHSHRIARTARLNSDMTSAGQDDNDIFLRSYFYIYVHFVNRVNYAYSLPVD